MALSPDGVESWNQIARAVGHVETASDGRLVNVHRIWILKAGKARRKQVHDDQIVLQEHDDGVRVLSFCLGNRELFNNVTITNSQQLTGAILNSIDPICQGLRARTFDSSTYHSPMECRKE